MNEFSNLTRNILGSIIIAILVALFALVATGHIGMRGGLPRSPIIEHR